MQLSLEAGKRDLIVAMLLTVSGGFLDAFTWLGHGHVFANTMTGNVVILGVSAAAGEWQTALRHVPPLAAFVVAIFVAHLLNLRSTGGRRLLRDAAVSCLVLEASFLSFAASGCIPVSDGWLIPGISFVATLQTMQFVHLEEFSYTSVMTTGNLRQAAYSFFAGHVPRKDPAALRKSRLMGLVSLSFLVGAVLGAAAILHLRDGALWVVVVLLLAALARIVQVARRAELDASIASGPADSRGG